MPFPSTVQASIRPVTEGELGDGPNIVLSTINWEPGLNIGRFAKIDAGRLDNLDGSSTPVLAGVVLRELNALLELAGQAGAAFANLLVSEKNQDYIRQGLVTVKLATGAATPTQFAPVYTINETDNADNGNVTPTSDPATITTTAEFVREIQTGIWEIRIK